MRGGRVWRERAWRWLGRRGIAGSRLGLALALVLAACRTSPQEGPSPVVSSAPTPAGFRRVEVEGLSLALPERFVDRPPPAEGESVEWLVHAGDGDAPGSPLAYLTRNRRPVSVPSAAYGRAVLEGLKRDGSKRVRAQREHQRQGVTMTDLELESKGRVQWRRVLVHAEHAYTMTYSVATPERERARAAATTVLDSLVLPPGLPTP